MLKKTKQINFRARSTSEFLVHDKPIPAAQAIPEWWRKATPYMQTPDNPDGTKLIIRNRVANANFKKCTPMLDALTIGYIVPLWTDVQLTNTEEGPYISWRTEMEVFEEHGLNSRGVPAPQGYSNRVFKYLNPWIPQTPPGYSLLVLPPLGYRDLPFQAIPGVIDTDESTLEVVFPVWVNSSFNGIVEQGTPMAQMIPFKRDDWKATFDSYENGEYKSVIQENNFNKTLVNHYVKKHWSKKSFK